MVLNLNYTKKPKRKGNGRSTTEAKGKEDFLKGTFRDINYCLKVKSERYQNAWYSSCTRTYIHPPPQQEGYWLLGKSTALWYSKGRRKTQ